MLGEVGRQLYIVGDDEVAKRAIAPVIALATQAHPRPVLGFRFHGEPNLVAVAQRNDDLPPNKAV